MHTHTLRGTISSNCVATDPDDLVCGLRRCGLFAVLPEHHNSQYFPDSLLFPEVFLIRGRPTQRRSVSVGLYAAAYPCDHSFCTEYCLGYSLSVGSVRLFTRSSHLTVVGAAERLSFITIYRDLYCYPIFVVGNTS